MQQNQIISDPTSGSDNTEIVANQDAQITQMEQSLAKQDEIIGNQNQDLAKQDEIIANQDEQVAKQDEQLNQQIDLNDLTNALYELIARLGFLPSVKGVSADIRVTPLSTPNMSTLTTLTTLTNQAQIGGYNANQQIPSLVNMTAQNNINNIIIS